MTPTRRREAACVLGLVMLGIVVRLAVVEATGAHTFNFADGPDYVETARRACQEGRYPDGVFQPFFRAPGLPALLMVVTGCDLSLVSRMRRTLGVVDGLTVLAVYALAAALGCPGRVRLLASAGAAVWPPLVAQSAGLTSESLFTPLLTGAVALGFLGADRSAALVLVASGAAAGAASLTRPSALAVVPFLAATCLAASRPPWVRLRNATLVLLGASAVVAPWTARNWSRYGELILVNDAAGPSLWWGAHPLFVRYEGPSFADTERRFVADYFRTAGAIGRRFTTPASRSGEWRRLAMQNVVRDPVGYTLATARKAARYWRPFLDPRVHALPVVAASLALHAPLYAAAALGLARLRGAGRRRAGAVAAYLALGCVVHLPMHVVMRFRVPFADPALIVLGAIAMGPWATSLRGTAVRVRSFEEPRSSPA